MTPPKTRARFGDLLNALGLLGQAVEVGVHRGDYSAVLLSRWRGRTLHLVDAWVHQPTGWVAKLNVADAEQEAALRHVRERFAPMGDRVRIVREFSVAAAAGFADGSLDFVYIDANHKYEAVKEDLEAWWPKVKAGGIFAGHDYLDGFIDRCVFGVKTAVDEFAYFAGLPVRTTAEPYPSWMILKP